MRLINVHTYKFSEFFDNTTRPKYAIASHRWASDEAKFEDVQEGRNEGSLGFRKVLAFAEYVKKNLPSVEWLWIDTCCINKKDAAELSYSINSMFKWYRNAEICVAYLSGTQNRKCDTIGQDEWFSRGWTLQELLAPRLVVFVTKDWQAIGRKGILDSIDGMLTGPDLGIEISNITGVPEHILHDWDRSANMRAEDKMTWMKGRKTTREEDIWYALFGIVGLTIGANYGEGEDGARNRLLMGLRQRDVVAAQDAKQRRRILEWLCPTDYSQQQNDLFALRSGKTGEWIFASPEYRKWSQDPGSSNLLLCYGDPGAGKTMMAVTVIRHLLETPDDGTTVATIYLFFNYMRKGEQDVPHILSTLLRQLVHAKDGVSDTLKALYERFSQRQIRPTQQELEEQTLAMISSFTRVNIIVDALDECRQDIQRRAIKTIESVYLSSSARVHVLITTRPLPDILNFIRTQPESAIELEIRASDSDLASHLEAQLSQYFDAGSASVRFREDIVETIVQKVNGIFLLAQLFVDVFRNIKKPKTVKAYLQKLKTHSELQDNLYDVAYDSAIARIEDQPLENRKLALEALAWISCAQRPLTPSELEHAIAVELDTDEDTNELDEDNIVQCDMIISCCAGLVIEDKETGIVRLAHFTTQTYLERKLPKLADAPAYDTHSAISMKCLAYLSFDTFATGPCATWEKFQERLQCYPFFDYAAKYWCVHVRDWERHNQDTTDQKVTRIATQARVLLDCPKLAESAAQGMLYRKSWKIYRRSKQESAAEQGKRKYRLFEIDKGKYKSKHGLHLLVQSGAARLFSALLAEQMHIINVRDGLGKSPLSWAASQGNTAIVELLLAKGNSDIDINSRDFRQDTPLIVASRAGHVAVVKLLLAEKSIVVDLCNSDGRDAMWAAVNEGHTPVVELFLATGIVDVNKPDNYHYTPLLSAAANGRTDTVRLLLARRGIDVESRTPDGTTPLYFAVAYGYAAIVALLLKHGANVNERSGRYGNAFFAACATGNHDIASQLLDGGFSYDDLLPDRLGRSRTLVAASYGFLPGIERDLRNESLHVDIDAVDNQQWTALHWAAYFGQLGVVDLLLQHGASELKLDWQGWTAFEVARFADNDPVAERLKPIAKHKAPKPAVQLHMLYCDSCGHTLFLEDYKCRVCPDYDLCFRCIRDVTTFHPEHEFVIWDEVPFFASLSPPILAPTQRLEIGRRVKKKSEVSVVRLSD